MTIYEKKVDAIARYLLSNNPATKKEELDILRDLMDGKRTTRSTREEIMELLTELGAPSKLFGYAYTLEAICIAVEDPNIAKHGSVSMLWTKIAELFGVKPGNVSRCVRNTVEKVFANCDLDLINQYFGGTVSPDKGKLICSEFIAECARVIRERTGG